MKKRVTAELISIAHRILKLKNHSETLQLQQEAKNLYDQLTVLRFYEENFEWIKDEISEDVLQSKLTEKSSDNLYKSSIKVEEAIEENDQETIAQKEIEKTNVAPISPINESQNEKNEVSEEVLKVSKQNEKTENLQEKKKIKEPNKNKDTATASQFSFEDLLVHDYQKLDFVKVEDVPDDIKKSTESSFEAIHDEVDSNIELPVEDIITLEKIEIPEETNFDFIAHESISKSNSLNDKLNSTITIGLNDRIGFEKKLFGGSSNDLNRVISQLNTFDSFEEAKAFVNDFVKPDYNNWEGVEEFEMRFMEIVEKKFN